MIVKVRTVEWYNCHLNDEQAERVREYAEENGLSLEAAISQLDAWEPDTIGLWNDVEQIDFTIDEVEDVWEE